MSKILEALRVAERETPKKSEYEVTQKQLADIYFSATGQSTSKELPVIIKVVEKPRLASLVPWILTSAAFLLTAFSLFSTKKIFVDIKIVEGAGAPTPAESAVGSPAVPVASDASTAEKLAFDDFVFEGAALLKSSKDGQGLTLVNSSVAAFARASYYFKEPVDLTSAQIVFFARGQRGGENLSVAAKDRGNVQAFSRGKVYPFPQGLSTQWQRCAVDFSNTVYGFDQAAVKTIRFDFGSKDTSNKAGDTVFIRDLRVVRPPANP